MGELVPAMKMSDLKESSISTVDIKGSHILLAHVGDEILAVSGTCTHEESDLGLGFLLEDRVVCALHLSQFDLRTGQVMNPPAEVPLKRFNVKIEDETIFVEI